MTASSKKPSCPICSSIRAWFSASSVTYSARPPWATWWKQIWLPRMVLPAPGEPWTMKMPPRKKPPRKTVSSPGTPVGMRLSCLRAGSSIGMFCAIRPQRQSDGERRSGASAAPNADLSPHGAHQLAGHPQPDAKPAIGLCSTGAMKALENQLLVAIRYADALVANRQPGQLAIAGERDLDGPPRSESNGIGTQIFQ